MGKKDEALAKLLQWQIEGVDAPVEATMREHPDMDVAEAVDLVEREHPELARRATEADDPEDPSGPRRPKGPELASLAQEFALFRHLLKPLEAARIDAKFKELSAHPNPEALAELRRRVRTLGLEASFWRELASPAKAPNALGLLILDADGGAIARSGETSYLEKDDVARAVRSELAKERTGLSAMHLPVGRLLVVHGGPMNFALLFRQVPGREVVDMLQKTVDAIRENPEAAARTFGDKARGGYFADALLRLVQRTGA